MEILRSVKLNYLYKDDVKARANCIRTLQYCAEICSMAACYMPRGSGSIKEVCDLCATICEKCTTECRNMVNM
ncbi:hypothetical protein [Clostridium sp. YIM B02551]|uniref:hypothetical protein n=1 Tax=Clostridium sp. YIM B02551 TaxID=2910679 RepID=UPI001EEB41C0|nr:hypothetical protein [Clostridium sp. YIM B02551]